VSTIKSAIMAVAFAFACSNVLAEPVAPDDLVKITANEVFGLIKNDEEIQKGDIKKISKILEEKVLPHFDLERMSRVVLGKAWADAPKEQKELFQKEFQKLVVHAFSLALSQYHGQPIRYMPLQAHPNDTEVVVKAMVLEPDDDPDMVDFSMEKKEAGWQVYDVTMDGVSFDTTYHGQFASAIRTGGLDGLIHKLAEKNKQPFSSTATAPGKRG